jgi:hypothetical protein
MKEFCKSDGYVAMKVSLTHEVPRQDIEYPIVAKILDAKGNPLWSTNVADKIEGSVNRHNAWPQETFPINQIILRSEETANLSIEIWIWERLIGKDYFSIRDCSPKPATVEPQERSLIANKESTVEPTFKPIVDDCATNRTGSYCFQNNSEVLLTVGSAKLAFGNPLRIRPGGSSCFYDVPVGAFDYQFSIPWQPGSGVMQVVEKGNLRIEQCVTPTFVYK